MITVSKNVYFALVCGLGFWFFFLCVILVQISDTYLLTEMLHGGVKVLGNLCLPLFTFFFSEQF